MTFSKAATVSRKTSKTGVKTAKSGNLASEKNLNFFSLSNSCRSLERQGFSVARPGIAGLGIAVAARSAPIFQSSEVVLLQSVRVVFSKSLRRSAVWERGNPNTLCVRAYAARRAVLPGERHRVGDEVRISACVSWGWVPDDWERSLPASIGAWFLFLRVCSLLCAVSRLKAPEMYPSNAG